MLQGSLEWQDAAGEGEDWVSGGGSPLVTREGATGVSLGPRGAGVLAASAHDTCRQELRTQAWNNSVCKSAVVIPCSGKLGKEAVTQRQTRELRPHGLMVRDGLCHLPGE